MENNQLDEDGKRHGIWEFQTSKGNMFARVNYVHGFVIGQSTSYRTSGDFVGLVSVCVFWDGKENLGERIVFEY